MEELEGKGQAAYSEGITDTISVFQYFRSGKLEGNVPCLLVYCQRGGTRG